jgi:hypothetical protein
MSEMIVFMIRPWKFWARNDLLLWWIPAIVVCLLVGLVCLQQAPGVFRPLEHMTLQDWILRYGKAHLGVTWWFLLFLLLVLALALNTLVCTTSKTLRLLRHRNRFQGRLPFWIKLSPHLIHYGFLFLLAGYLAFFSLGTQAHQNILRLHSPQGFAGLEHRVELLDLQLEFDDESEDFQGRLVDARAHLRFCHENGTCELRTIGVNQPTWIHGYSVHLRDFRPKRKKSGMTPYVNLILQENKGLHLFLAGLLVFVLGLALYIGYAFKRLERSPRVENKRSSCA